MLLSRKRACISVIVPLLMCCCSIEYMFPIIVKKCSPVSLSDETVSRLKHGMSLAEVEALLGGPPGDYTFVYTNGTGFYSRGAPGVTANQPVVWISKEWRKDDRMMIIWFDSAGRVKKIEDWHGRNPEITFSEWILLRMKQMCP